MDDQRFDVLTRVFSGCTSRRQVLGLLAAMALGSGRPATAAAAQDDGAAPTCDPGLTYCPEAGACVDTCCNNDHCGACGNVCPSGLTCFEGVCDCPSGLCCAEGEVICNGACVATCCDNDNCGACGNVCSGGLTCFEGVCGCPSGLCPPVKLPNTGRGGTDLKASGNRWAAMAMTGAAAVSALMWRTSSRWGVAQSREDW